MKANGSMENEMELVFILKNMEFYIKDNGQNDLKNGKGRNFFNNGDEVIG